MLVNNTLARTLNGLLKVTNVQQLCWATVEAELAAL